MKRNMESEGAPPILGSWGRFYRVVLLLHASLILLFYLITKAYS